jgi:antitoxin component YwqK of YwqJK toxin-antitoxin module
MTKRAVFNVIKNSKDDKWDVRRPGADRASSKHDTKQAAISDAKDRAKSETLGQVKIWKENGQIQTEYTYGNDKFPPAG